MLSVATRKRWIFSVASLTIGLRWVNAGHARSRKKCLRTCKEKEGRGATPHKGALRKLAHRKLKWTMNSIHCLSFLCGLFHFALALWCIHSIAYLFSFAMAHNMSDVNCLNVFARLILESFQSWKLCGSENDWKLFPLGKFAEKKTDWKKKKNHENSQMFAKFSWEWKIFEIFSSGKVCGNENRWKNKNLWKLSTVYKLLKLLSHALKFKTFRGKRPCVAWLRFCY